MATIDYKEKYEQALEKVRVMLGTGDYTRESLEYVFPELKESEDEKIRKDLIGFIKHKIAMGSITTEEREHSNSWIAWLEKQGEQKPTECRTTGYWLVDKQKPAEWSEEDERNINAIRTCIYYNCNAEDASNAITWLNSLKDRVQPQPKQEWSEEDESHIRYIIECLENCKKGVALTMTTSTAQEYINWLKSLRPQNTWKPSEEQMKALDKAIYDVDDSIATQLAMLIGDLRKLKGE